MNVMNEYKLVYIIIQQCTVPTITTMLTLALGAHDVQLHIASINILVLAQLIEQYLVHQYQQCVTYIACPQCANNQYFFQLHRNINQNIIKIDRQPVKTQDWYCLIFTKKMRYLVFLNKENKTTKRIQRKPGYLTFSNEQLLKNSFILMNLQT